MSLRKINSLEMDKRVSELPDNVYGYAYGGVISSVSIFSGNNFSKLSISKRNPSRYGFEVKKFNSSDVRLVGYVSDETLLIYSSKGLSENEIIVFSIEYQEYKNPIEIQLINQSLKISDRDIEFDDSKRFTILEISKLPSKDDSTKTKNVDSKVISSQIETKITKENTFIQQILLHKYYSLLLVFIIILIIFLVTGISPKDLLP